MKEQQPDAGTLTSKFTPDEIETALRTLAELYDNSDDTGEYLSSYQQEIAERVLNASTEENG